MIGEPIIIIIIIIIIITIIIVINISIIIKISIVVLDLLGPKHPPPSGHPPQGVAPKSRRQGASKALRQWP